LAVTLLFVADSPSRIARVLNLEIQEHFEPGARRGFLPAFEFKVSAWIISIASRSADGSVADLLQAPWSRPVRWPHWWAGSGDRRVVFCRAFFASRGCRHAGSRAVF